MITYLHHTDPVIPHYRGTEWNFQRGAAATVDRPILGWQGKFFLHYVAHYHVIHHVSFSCCSSTIYGRLNPFTVFPKNTILSHSWSDQVLGSISWRVLRVWRYACLQGTLAQLQFLSICWGWWSVPCYYRTPRQQLILCLYLQVKCCFTEIERDMLSASPSQQVDESPCSDLRVMHVETRSSSQQVVVFVKNELTCLSIVLNRVIVSTLLLISYCLHYTIDTCLHYS